MQDKINTETRVDSKYKDFIEAMPDDINRKLSFHDMRRIFRYFSQDKS